MKMIRMGNRAAWNRVNKERTRQEWAAYLATYPVEIQRRDPAVIAAEDADIARRREAFPLH